MNLQHKIKDCYELTTRTGNCLGRSNIKRFDQLITYNEKDLLRIEGMGRKSVAEIRAMLHKFGLSLDDPRPDTAERPPVNFPTKHRTITAIVLSGETLAYTGGLFSLSRNRIRQIVMKSVQRCHHPTRVTDEIRECSTYGKGWYFPLKELRKNAYAYIRAMFGNLKFKEEGR